MFTEEDIGHVRAVVKARVSGMIDVGNFADAISELERTQQMIDDERAYRITLSSTVEQAGVDEPTAEKLANHGIVTLRDVEFLLDEIDNRSGVKRKRIGLKTLRMLRGLIQGVTSMPTPCGFECIIDFIDLDGKKILPTNGSRVRLLVKSPLAQDCDVWVEAKLCGCDGALDDVVMKSIQCSFDYPYHYAPIEFSSTRAAAGVKCYFEAKLIGPSCEETFYRKVQIGART